MVIKDDLYEKLKDDLYEKLKDDLYEKLKDDLYEKLKYSVVERKFPLNIRWRKTIGLLENVSYRLDFILFAYPWLACTQIFNIFILEINNFTLNIFSITLYNYLEFKSSAFGNVSMSSPFSANS